MSRPLWAILFLGALSAVATGQSQSQPNETLPGFKAENVLEARGIDNVSPFSGDPTVVIPIGPEYTLSTAFKWQLTAHYSVKFWDLTGVEFPYCSPEGMRYAFVLGDPTIGVGWALQLGYVVYSEFDPNGPWIYFAPDGGRHGVSLDATGVDITSDGSHLRVTAIGGAGPQSPSYYTVEFPDGTKEFFEHTFLPPGPDSGDSKDFTNVPAYELLFQTPFSRYGLTRIQDRFGKTVLRVNYDAGHPWQPTGIVLDPDGAGNGPTVSLHWVTTASLQSGMPISWWVIDWAQFPAAGSLRRKASFGYQFVSFNRNPYDLSFSPGNTCYRNPTTVPSAPLLSGITYSDPDGTSFAPFSYTFDYSGDDGTLQKITLPTNGTLEYTYGLTTGSICQLPSCNPDLPISSPTPPAPNFPPNIQPFRNFLDHSSAVRSRVETDPATGRRAETTYARQLIIRCIDSNCTEGDDSRLFRKVVVTAPGNDNAADGPTKFATRSFFTTSQDGYFAGIEVDRRSYNGVVDSGTPVRTLIRCYGHNGSVCGYRDAAGQLQQYNTGIEPPQAEVTWYGAVPAGSDGGVCAGTNPRCSASTSSDYNAAAGQYRVNQIRSTLLGAPSGPIRTTTTDWNPQTGSAWMLDLFNYKRVTDAVSPTPADVQTNFSFDLSNGFLIGTSVTDSYGTRNETFDHDPGVWLPKTATVSGSGPGLSGAQFVDNRTFDGHGLVLTSQRSGMSWKSFDVDRDSNTGLITVSRDPNPALATFYRYDALGRLKTITPPGGDAGTTITYVGPNETVVSRSGTDGHSTWQRFTYDSFGRLSREIRAMPSGYAVRGHAYDLAGHRNFISEWQNCSSGSAGGDCESLPLLQGTTSSSFDPFGRPQRITRADGTQTTIDRTDDPILFSDSLDSVTVNVGVSASTTSTRHDALGRIITVTEPNVGHGMEDTSYTYNALDKLAGVAQGVQARTFVYDSFGFLRSETTPEKGNVSYSPYDALGNVLTETQSDETPILRVYDTAGRLQKTTAGGSVYLRNCYDGPTVACVDGLANPAGGTYPFGKLTQRYGYNPTSSPPLAVTDSLFYSSAAGRLSSQTTSFDSGFLPPATQSWTYNSLGLASQHAHYRASGAPFIVTTAYSQGLPASEYANGMPVVSGVTYAPSGALFGYTTGLGVGTSIVTTIQPDTSGIPRPAEIWAQPSGSSSRLFDTGTYAYDGAGNILSMTNGSSADSYGYDARSRLTSATLTLSGLPNQSYTYDRYGNRTSGLPPGCQIDTATNRLAAIPGQGCSAGYNPRGDMTQTSSSAYAYDSLDRTITAPGWTYLYDGASERVVKTSGSRTYTLRDEAMRVSAEFTDTGTQSRDNLFLGNLLVASYANAAVGPPSSNGPIWTFYSSDHLGTPRLITDLAGSPVATPKYLPFGEEVTPSTLNHIRFASMERDTEGSWYHDHARNHEFNLSRFLSPDARYGKVEAPQTWNRYSYGGDNPLRYIDPNGAGVLDFVVGAAAQFASNVFLGAIPVNSSNPDFQEGQRAGDIISIVFAEAESKGAGTAMLGGLLAAPETAGATAVVAGAGVLVQLHAAGVAVVATVHLMEGSGGSSSDPNPDRNLSQDKKLSGGDIKKLQGKNLDPEELKGGRSTGKLDLYKDSQGNVYVKPKGGSGPGEFTGVNINRL